MIEIKVFGSGSSGNAYKIKMGETTFLMECGLPYKKIQRLSDFSMSNYDFCLITHEHL